MQNQLLNSRQTVDLNTLSSAELLEKLIQQQSIEDQLRAQAERQLELIRSRDQYIETLEEYIRLLKIQKYGAKSEKLPYQGDLFDEVELEEALSDLEDEIPEDQLPPEAASRGKKSRNRGFSAELPRKRIEIKLTELEKFGALRTFFTKVKEELEYIPAQLNVLEYWQEKAVFREGEGDEEEERIIAAQRTPHPLGKCFASTSLLAHIITAKYTDGLPLYRQEKIFKRLGADVSRSNMAHWVVRLTEVFQPLINLMRETQNSCNYIQADESRMYVLKEDGKRAQSDKWMWVSCGGPPRQPVVLFEYDPSRSGKVAERILDGFSGVLQADGYSGYSRVCRKQEIQRIGCMDHARRKFVDASRAAAPSSKKKGKNSRPVLADIALRKIRQLYRIEKQIKEESDDKRYQVRQKRSIPVLEDLKEWLDLHLSKTPKDSLTRKAITYALNQWEYLIGYCDRGDLEISNARAENAIRPFAVGRRAWLFADTPQGARASAICYSLVETAKANERDPSEYIQHILDHIATADTLESVEALLPWNVALNQRK